MERLPTVFNLKKFIVHVINGYFPQDALGIGL